VRVTDKLMFHRAATSAARAREQVEAATAELATGLRIRHPGDHPAGAGLAVGHRQAAGRMAAIGAAAGKAADELAVADDALGGVGATLDRARELAIQMANDSYGPAQRAAAGAEMRMLLGQAVALLNSRAGARYVFAGTRDDQPPFDAAGNYLGTTAPRRVEIAPGVTEAAAPTGNTIAKGPVDIPAMLSALASALDGNDAQTVRSTLGDMEDAVEQVAQARARIGSSMALFTGAAEVSRVGQDAEIAAISALVDADAVDAASRMALAQRALDAALTASARSFALTLLDKLR